MYLHELKPRHDDACQADAITPFPRICDRLLRLRIVRKLGAADITIRRHGYGLVSAFLQTGSRWAKAYSKGPDCAIILVFVRCLNDANSIFGDGSSDYSSSPRPQRA